MLWVKMRTPIVEITVYMPQHLAICYFAIWKFTFKIAVTISDTLNLDFLSFVSGGTFMTATTLNSST